MHDREIPEEVRFMRGFYSWLLAPITHEITHLRNEQADFRREVIRRLRTMETDMSALIDELKTEVVSIRNAATAMATAWALAMEVMDAALAEAKAKGMSDEEAAILRTAIDELKAENAEIVAETLKNTRAAPDVPAMEVPPPTPPAEPV